MGTMRTALSSGMGRRMAADLCLCALAPVAGFALAAAGLGSLAAASLVAFAIAVICVLATVAHVSRSYLPALRAARSGLNALRERRFAMPRIGGLDEPRAVLEALARTATDVQDQWRVFETLAEIDRLLITSASLEQVLDAMLSRIQALTRCRAVGITLRDDDAPGRGRVYIAAAPLGDLPVSRLRLDQEMLELLAACPQGLTIARCEPVRHSFLMPLKRVGAEIFWVWPVMVAGRVEAILAAGFAETPTVGVSLSRGAGELAARLGAALSRAAREARLYREARYDPLTELPNRLLFRDHLCGQVAGSVTGSSRGALLYIDLDHFKRVNDGYGHDVGDHLLRVVSQRLRACVKEGDLVARLGGDEFTVVLREIRDAGAAAAVAERVAATLRLPVRIGASEHHISASIGVTFFPDDGTRFEDLVRNADSAMYRAKEAGRERIMFFERSNVVPRLHTLEACGLKRTLGTREFTLYYQPQFAVADGALVAVEALLRWHAPDDGVCSAEDFVPAAEQSGLVSDIAGWVLDAACSQFAAWREAGIAPARLAVNVWAPEVEEAELARGIRGALAKHDLPAGLLEIELSGRVLRDAAAEGSIARLAEVGVRLALGDFDAEHASAADLRRSGVDCVRLNRGLVSGLPHDRESTSTVAASIAAAHALGKCVVAPGVETIEQLDFLREHGCDLVQGFYLARPLAASAVTELLHARVARLAGDDSVREVG